MKRGKLHILLFYVCQVNHAFGSLTSECESTSFLMFLYGVLLSYSNSYFMAHLSNSRLTN